MGFLLSRFSARKKISSLYLLRNFYLCLAHQKYSLRHRLDDHESLFSKSVQNYILEMPEKWCKGDPRLCSLCILYALNTTVDWHYWEGKIRIICPSISDAECVWSVLGQKVCGLIKTWCHTLTQSSEKFPMTVLHYGQWLKGLTVENMMNNMRTMYYTTK